MSVRGQEKFFFVHVMKTGGTSFAEIVRENFSREERYPDACLAEDADFGRRTESYVHVPSIVADVNRNSASLRMVAGHIPYATRRLFQATFTAMTVLRHPVERTVSYLKHCRQFHPEHAALPFEAIYEQPWFNAMFMSNYQTRIFSMSAEEALAESRLDIERSPLPPLAALKRGEEMSPQAKQFMQEHPARFILELFASCTGAIDVDDVRLRAAIANLKEVEVVGVTEHYERFLRRLEDSHGWKIGEIPRKNPGSGETISSELARRIEQDCSADMALYETALTLCA